LLVIAIILFELVVDYIPILFYIFTVEGLFLPLQLHILIKQAQHFLNPKVFTNLQIMLIVYYVVYVGVGVIGMVPFLGARCTSDIVYPICFLIMWLINAIFIVGVAVLKKMDFFIE
jgi:hypothetical protein